MTTRTCQAIILAAGEGTRMKSRQPKVLHELAGKTMLGHVLALVKAVGANRCDVVVGPDMASVADLVNREAPDARIFIQTERLGTGHAVLAARDALETPSDDVLILYGDTPLVTTQSLEKMREGLAKDSAIAVLGFRTDDPGGYGRLITDNNGNLLAIREDKDATTAEREIDFCNSGVMAFDGKSILALLESVGKENVKGEYYLTDTVEIARQNGDKVVAIEGSEDEVLGINSRGQLAEAELIAQRKLRKKALAAGVTMISPETVFLASDTELSADVVIEPNVFFGPGVKVGEGATIRAFSHIEGAVIGDSVVVGPFARLRPGAKLGKGSKIGNFVEVKNAEFGEGAKANHLAYIGDAQVGDAANIGAGTITCNYDGYRKHRTEIGHGAFIGTNSSLVAPVKIGDGAYIGSGSVITRDVESDALAVARGKQISRSGWAKKMREKMTGNKPKNK
jgi:bifunctional UDP-N-acetylglucosamine pyrophosphorylase / glucosamine-1-phosphate N-acetyltransferase